MAERVQVIIDAKDNASGVLRGLTAQMGALGGTVEQLTGASINWGNVAQQATRMIVDVLQRAYQEYSELATAVRDLSLASGATAEESSRLLQVLDDFEIKANDVTTATKALTRNGLAPTVQTIAQLSDEYLKLNTAEERNAFITENLGRGGAKWANVLKEGSENILALNASVSQNLILTDEQIRLYEVQRLAIDNLQDQVDGWLVQLGQNVGLVIAYNEALLRANEIYVEQGGVLNGLHTSTVEYKDAVNQAMAEQLQMANSSLELSGGLDEAGRSAEEASGHYEKLLSMAQKFNDATREHIKLAGFQELKAQLQESGGVITEDEAALLNQAGVALGIFDQHAVNSAASVTEFTDALVAGNVTLERYVQLLNSIPTSIDVQINQTTVSSTQGSILAGNAASLNAGAETGKSSTETKTQSGTVNNYWGNNTLVLDNASGFMGDR